MKKFDLRLIIKVKAKAGYLLECYFDNGEVKTYDMSFLKNKSGTMLVPFKDEKFF